MSGVKDVWIKNKGESRGKPRIYLDGLQAVRTGFAPGDSYEIDVEGTKVVLTKKDDGSHVVSSKKVKRKSGEVVFPVIDINSAEFLSIFDGMDAIRVVVTDAAVYLLPLASEVKRVDRLSRLKHKLSNGLPLDAGSFAHGGGVLAHAVHRGIQKAGIECNLRFANEIRDDLLFQAIENNDVWNDETSAIALPMQELAQDEWLLNRLPKLDLLEGGIPCSGASRGGVSKNKLTKMEDHAEVGHLVYSALVMISKTNPSIFLLENVPAYAESASAQILRHQLRDMGYKTHEAILKGNDFGCIEQRVRWCMVATTVGIDFSFEGIQPVVHVVRVLDDYLDKSITEDDPRWREVGYLREKEKRDAEKGSSFKMQYITPSDTSIPVLRKGYQKGGSTDPRLVHPSNPALSRLLTGDEHGRVKDVPPEIFDGMSDAMKHQLLGQGIAYSVFDRVGEHIGNELMALAEGTPSEEVESAMVTRRQRYAG